MPSERRKGLCFNLEFLRVVENPQTKMLIAHGRIGGAILQEHSFLARECGVVTVNIGPHVPHPQKLQKLTFLSVFLGEFREKARKTPKSSKSALP